MGVEGLFDDEGGNYGTEVVLPQPVHEIHEQTDEPRDKRSQYLRDHAPLKLFSRVRLRRGGVVELGTARWVVHGVVDEAVA
jgi:hypothetical protein